GTYELFHFSLVIPIVPALFTVSFLLFYFPDSPRSLLRRSKEYGEVSAAREALQMLRSDQNVETELERMYKDASDNNDKLDNVILLTSFRVLFWPYITIVLLSIAQQFSGFYFVRINLFICVLFVI